MLSSYSRYQRLFSRLFIILITFFALEACVFSQKSDNRSAYERSINRPATHKVKSGDTLFSIAWRYGLKYQDLAKYNKISTFYRIYPGQVIKLYPPVTSKTWSKDKANINRSSAAGASIPYSKNNRSKFKTQKKIGGEKDMHQTGAPVWQWPSRGSILKHFAGSSTLSKGIDIGGNLGEPVLAAASGQVVYAGNGLRGYGRLLIVRHNDSFLSAYAHNNRLLVKEGDFVKAGQKIADMGSSGTEGVKLHFEIRRDGTPEDPLKFLPER